MYEALGGGLAQELAPGGDIAEEIFDRHGRALGTAPGRGSLSIPCSTTIRAPAAHRSACRPDRQAGDRANAGQRLAPESERLELLEIVERRQFRCRVSLDGQRQALRAAMPAPSSETRISDRRRPRSPPRSG